MGAAVLLLLSTPLVGPAAHASVTVTVTTTSDVVADDGRCSLREAVSSANNLAPSGTTVGECPAIGAVDTIRLLAKRTYNLTISGPDENNNVSGDLDIKVDALIVGARRTRIRQTVAGQRVVDVEAGNVGITSVTISGGHAPDGVIPSPGGRPGGGILNLGTLTLRKVTVAGNTAGNGSQSPGPTAGPGGSGGGVASGGTLFVFDSVITGNRAGDGGDSTPYSGQGTVPGPGGLGGGLYNTGNMTVTGTRIQRNAGGTGGDAIQPVSGAPAFNGGGGGGGGGIANAADAYVGSSTISGNVGGSGGRGGDACVPNSPTLGPAGQGGTGGFGAGILMNAGGSHSIAIVDDVIRGNAGGRGGRGGDGSQSYVPTSPGGLGGPGGYGGYGGGLYTNAFMTVTGTTVAGNATGIAGSGGAGGPGTPNGPPGPSYLAGAGGGAYVTTNGGFIAVNSTFSANRAGDSGGAIVSTASATLNSVTVTRNVANADGLVGGGGGGIYHAGGTFTVQNTIVSGNAVLTPGGIGPDCAGAFSSAGYNLVTNDGTCTGLTGGTDINGRSARLGPLQNNGGPTPTHALLRGSPAINAGDPATPGSTHCATTDQRGRDRIPRQPCDIGAFER